MIPKEAAETLDQLSDPSAEALGRVLPRICRAVMQATGATAYNVLQNNGSAAHQAVRHVHFHIIPRFEGSGFQISWEPGSLDEATAHEIAGKIRRAVSPEPLAMRQDTP